MIMLLMCSLFASISSALVSPAVGYGSSDAVAPPKTQELFLLGFETGLNMRYKRSGSPTSLAVDQVSGGGSLGAIGSARRLLEQHVAVLAGFPTSHEALLVAPLASERNVLFLTAGAGHSKLARSGRTVYTIGESAQSSANSIIDFVERHFVGRRGLIISNPFAAFSKDQADAFLAEVRKRKIDKRLKFGQLDRSLRLSNDTLTELRSRKFDYLIITTYADESVKLLNQLKQANLDLPIVTNTAWTTGDIDLIRRYLTQYKSPIYAAFYRDKSTKEFKNFEKLILKKFGRPATTEIAMGYDVGVIVGTTLNAVVGPITANSVLAAFHRIGCFDGTSLVRICFDDRGGFASRTIPMNFVRFTNRGFIPVE